MYLRMDSHVDTAPYMDTFYDLQHKVDCSQSSKKYR